MYIHQYLGSKELYKTSGHWDHYQDSMFPLMEMDNETLVLTSNELSTSYDGL